MPASFARRSQDSSVCSAGAARASPGRSSAARPPNAMMSFVCLTIDGQSVTRPVTGPSVADDARQEEDAPRRSCSCRPGRCSRRRETGIAAPACGHDARGRPTTSRRSRRRSPCRRASSRTRASSAATVSSASSQDTSWNVSWPVRGRPSRQPSRIAGRAMRSGECTISGIDLSMSDGAGSRANGSQPTRRPSSTSAVKAPQWASDGKRATVMAIPV